MVASSMSHPARSHFSAAQVAGLLFLAVQAVVAIAHSVSDQRWVHYTPYAGQTAYRLNVSVDGRPLSDVEIRKRYGLAFRGHTQLTPDALQHIVIDREGSGTTAAAGGLFVRLHYSRQGAPEEIWLWPQH